MTPESIEVTQKSSIGSETTQIGIQNNNIGLSPTDATNIAFAIFREYYPQLRQEALSDIEQILNNKLQSLPPEYIVPPTPKIAVPALQNASITEARDIRKLYANLLANSMNKVVKDGIHPGFVGIINQLCPDEAKILVQFYMQKVVPTITLRSENERGEGVNIIKDFSNISELAQCEYPLKVKMYFDNLIRLGLIETSMLASLTDKTLYDPLKNHPYIISKQHSIEKSIGEYNKPAFAESFLSITEFGNEFCEKCVIDVTTIILPKIDLNI